VDDFYQTGQRGTVVFDGSQGPWAPFFSPGATASASMRGPGDQPEPQFYNLAKLSTDADVGLPCGFSCRLLQPRGFFHRSGRPEAPGICEHLVAVRRRMPGRSQRPSASTTAPGTTMKARCIRSESQSLRLRSKPCQRSCGCRTGCAGHLQPILGRLQSSHRILLRASIQNRSPRRLRHLQRLHLHEVRFAERRSFQHLRLRSPD
jgi:hypothetical protein